MQLAGDALIVSAFIYFTGGITSYFSSLYVLPIIAASTVQFRRGGLLVATLSTVLYVGARAGAVPGGVGLLRRSVAGARTRCRCRRRRSRSTPSRSTSSGSSPSRCSAARWPNSLRSAGARLEQASTEIADLQALNQHVIDSLPSGLATTDPAQRILTFNRARRGDHRRAVPVGRRPADRRRAAAAARR